MEEFEVRTAEFLREQDGSSERVLKAALADVLREDGRCAAAYLARIRVRSKETVALCIKPDLREKSGLVAEIGRVFASLFSSSAHLDIIFLSPAQEVDLIRVCTPFFVVATPKEH